MFRILCTILVLSASGAHAESGWICHFHPFPGSLANGDRMEKLDIRGGELVEDNSPDDRLLGGLADQWRERYRIVSNGDAGLIATMATTDSGDAFAITIAIDKNSNNATEATLSTKTPELDAVFAGECRSY